MKKKLHVLLTNDDGIDFPGLMHLYQGIKDYADVSIVAPCQQKSGTSQSLTLSKPLSAKQVNWEDGALAYRVTGTPVDCIKVALGVLLESPPDLILSGINQGNNAGRTILYSGTIGGIIEGVYSGIPGIAFSYFKEDETDYNHIEKFITPIVEYLISVGIPKGAFYNVNFPEMSKHKIEGFKVVPHGQSNWKETYTTHHQDDEGMTLHYDGSWTFHPEDDGTDSHYLKEGYITASPIQIGQLTDFSMLEDHKDPFEKHISQLI